MPEEAGEARGQGHGRRAPGRAAACGWSAARPRPGRSRRPAAPRCPVRLCVRASAAPAPAGAGCARAALTVFQTNRGAVNDGQGGEEGDGEGEQGAAGPPEPAHGIGLLLALLAAVELRHRRLGALGHPALDGVAHLGQERDDGGVLLGRERREDEVGEVVLVVQGRSGADADAQPRVPAGAEGRLDALEAVVPARRALGADAVGAGRAGRRRPPARGGRRGARRGRAPGGRAGRPPSRSSWSAA